MTIFRTPDQTKYPDSVLKASQLLPGLEALTGADLLVSHISEPIVKSVCEPLSLPQRLSFQKHVRAGRLIQVKIGGDLLNSIENLDSILKRMLVWTPRPWLLFVGDLKEDRDGQAIIDGRASGWKWSSVNGALVTWQERGGLLDCIAPFQMAEWLNGWGPRLKRFEENAFHCVQRPVAQTLIGTPSAVETLATFDNIGVERAKVLLEKCGTLAYSLVQLSDPVTSIPGLGDKTYQLARRRLGLREGDVLGVYTKETTIDNQV